MKTTTLWTPYVEWAFTCEVDIDRPYDVVAEAVFVHEQSNDVIKTGLFFDEGRTWKLRFSGTKPGRWTFSTTSVTPALNGLKGDVLVDDRTEKHGRGFVEHQGNMWSWSGSGDVFSPQLVMYHNPGFIYQNPEILDVDIQTFLVDHGFSGFHIPVLCRWLDIDHENYDDIDHADPVPDSRTFESLEQVIKKVYAAGGMVHLWMWGDNDANHHQTPMKEGWGGKNGRVDCRLQRYLAARLGPIPGWTMGYGFDLEHWVTPEDLQIWYQNMKSLLGWPHLLGGRSGGPARDGLLRQIWDGLDYAGYTHFRPTYSDYVDAMQANLVHPVMSEDRFRIRQPSPYPDKDYDIEMTRRGLWHATMAGGAANIWGYMQPGQRGSASIAYPNRQQIKTYTTFWQNRFTATLKIDLAISDACALLDARNHRIVLYQEDASFINIDTHPDFVSLRVKCVAVDTKSAYREVDIEQTNTGVQLPYASDWALVLQYS